MSHPDTTQRDVRRRLVAGLAAFIVPVILVALALILLAQVRAANSLRREEASTQEQRSLLASVLSDHQDIETGSRGYVIAGKESFLQPLRSGTAQLAKTAPVLRQSYVDDPEDLAMIDHLLTISREKQAFVRKTVALRRAGFKDRAEAQISEGRGKRLMDGIRKDIAELLARENTRLRHVVAEYDRATAFLRTLSFGLLVVLLLLLGGAWLALRRTIASRDRALTDLRDVSQRRQAVLEGAMDGIVTINPSGSIEGGNPAFERMFGYSLAELERRDVGMLLATRPPIGEVARLLHAMELPEHGPGASHEIEVLRKDGSAFPAEVALSAVRLTEGLRYVAVIRDATERKRIERLKTEFVSTVSHELRTPLTSIAGSLGLLSAQAGNGLDARAARLVEIARSNADRLVRLINDILDIEKMESGRMPFNNQELDLCTQLLAARDAIDGYAREYAVKVMFEPPSGPVLVSADRDRLAQVFDNLLSNAVKFSPREGTVTVELDPGTERHAIRITDQGPGIPAEFQDRIFGKFAQADASDSRQKGGTGLGLSIVREIMRRLGGEVDFLTAPGESTTFRLLLPAMQPVSVDAVGPATPVLLVCGNGAASTFTAALRKAGYEVRLARTVAELEPLLESRAFDAVVVDMGLPDGAGIAMIRIIRESPTNESTPLLALGGRPGASELDGDAALVLDWLHKPGEVSRLVDRIDAAAFGQTGKLPRVLHVEDDPDVVALLATALEGHAEVVAAPGVVAARTELRRQSFDLAVVDLTLADGSGIALLPELRAIGRKPLPVVIFSAQDADPSTASLVDAYLTKSRTPISSLVAIVGSLARAHSNQEPSR